MANVSSRSKGFFADFKEFLAQGNVVDLAVAVIIGAAFGKIVESLITDIITPLILNPVMTSLGVDQLENLSANGIKYGIFLASVINFLVIALVIFIMVRSLEAARRRQARAEALAEPEVDPALEVQQKLANSLDRLTEVINRQ